MPVGSNGDRQMVGQSADVALLKRVCENAAVMALKRRFDSVDSTHTGGLRRADFTRGYHQLCPWDDRMLTKTSLIGEYDEMANGMQEVSFMTFLLAAATRHPKSLLPEHALAFINRKVEQAIVETPLLAGDRDVLRKEEIAAFVKSLYGTLEFPSFASNSSPFGNPILAPMGKGHGVRISQDKMRPARDPRLETLMDAPGCHNLSTAILSTGMLPLDVEGEALEKALQSLPFELPIRNGDIKQTESIMLYHAQEMNADHITFETPHKLGMALSLICELEQLQEGEEAAWEEKLRVSDIPGAAYQYIMLLQCDELMELELQDSLGDSPADVSSLDAVVIPLSEAICASNLCAGSQDLVIFYRGVETELQMMVSGVTLEERKARQRSVAGSFGCHCFRHIRQMEHEEVVFESPEQLVAALRLLTELPEPEPTQVEEKLKSLGLLESAKKHIREKTQLQFAKAKAVKSLMEAVLAAMLAAPQLVKATANDFGAFESILTRMLQESRQLDDKSLPSMRETVVQLQVLYLRNIARMDGSLKREFSSFAQVASALNFLCMQTMNQEALAVSSLTEPVKRFIERADRTVMRVLPNVLDTLQDKERIFGFDMLVNNYWAASAQIDAGINGVREMVRALSRMYTHNKVGVPIPGHNTLFKPRTTPGKPGAVDDSKGRASPENDDEEWVSTGTDYDHMPTYKKATEVSRIAFDSAIKAHFRFMKSVNAGVIAPLQSWLDNQFLTKRKLDEETKRLEAQIKQGRLVLGEEQRNCEIAYAVLKDEVKRELGKKDNSTLRHKKDKIGVRRARVAEMFKNYEANVYQIARVESIIKQGEIAVRLRQLEEMERYRQVIVTNHVDKFQVMYQVYMLELQDHNDVLTNSVERLKNNSDLTNAVKQWLRETGPDPISYRLPCRPEQILSMEVGEQLPEERASEVIQGGGAAFERGLGALGISDLGTLHCGFLKKKNQNTNFATQWATRYFILRLEPDGKKYTLNYYHSLDDAAKRHIVPEIIPLDQVEYVITTLNKKQRNPEDNYRFDLKLRAGARSLERAELCLRTESKEQCVVWVARLQEAGVTIKEEIQNNNSPLESPEAENELTNAQLTTKILYEGPIKKKSTSRHGHIWLGRHFVLRSNNVLYYYDGASDAKHLRNPRWLKAEDIAEIQLPELGKGAQDGVRLNLIMRNSLRTFDLLAADPASCQEWCRQLSSVIHMETPVGPDSTGRQSISGSRPNPPTPATEKQKFTVYSSTSPKGAFSPKILPALHDNRFPANPRPSPPIPVRVSADFQAARGTYPADEPERKKGSNVVRESLSGMFQSMKLPATEEPRKSFTAGLRDSVVAVRGFAQRHSKGIKTTGAPDVNAAEDDMSGLEEMSNEDIALAQQFERCLAPVVKNRLSILKARRVQDCFSGRDAITAMVASGMGRDRKEALDIGNRLLRLSVFFAIDKNTSELKDSDKFLYRLERDSTEARMSLTGDYHRSTSGPDGYSRNFQGDMEPVGDHGESYQPVRKHSTKKNPPPPPPSPFGNVITIATAPPPPSHHLPTAMRISAFLNGGLPRPADITPIKPERAGSDTASQSPTSRSSSLPATRRGRSESNVEVRSEPSSVTSNEGKDEPRTPEAKEVQKLRFSISRSDAVRTDEDGLLGQVATFLCGCGEKLEGNEDRCALCIQNAEGDGGAELVVIQTEVN